MVEVGASVKVGMSLADDNSFVKDCSGMVLGRVQVENGPSGVVVVSVGCDSMLELSSNCELRVRNGHSGVRAVVDDSLCSDMLIEASF